MMRNKIKNFWLLLSVLVVASSLTKGNARVLNTHKARFSPTPYNNTLTSNTTETANANDDNEMSDAMYVVWLLFFIMMFLLMQCIVFRGCIH